MEIRQKYWKLFLWHHPIIARTKKLKDAISSQCEANAVRALDSAKPVLPAINSINEAPPFAARNSDHLMDSAREILAIHGYAGSLQVATLGG